MTIQEVKILLIYIAKFIYINGTAFLTASGKTRLMLVYTSLKNHYITVNQFP